MKHLNASALLVLSMIAAALAGPASAENCVGGGVPRLNDVARRLHVRPAEPSRSALNSCDGRSYEIGALLSAAIGRIERIESSQRKEGKRQ